MTNDAKDQLKFKKLFSNSKMECKGYYYTANLLGCEPITF